MIYVLFSEAIGSMKSCKLSSLPHEDESLASSGIGTNDLWNQGPMLYHLSHDKDGR